MQENLKRNREAGHYDLYKGNIHSTNSIYPEHKFWHCFRMSRKLFLDILHGVRTYATYFKAKHDATGKIGFSSYQKCSVAIRQLAYGVLGYLVDEYLRMSESTCIEAMYRFCTAITAMFGEVYLREPTIEDTIRLLSINEKRGFPGMLGSIDCMHWE
jgi:hypothetical protein